MHSVPTADLRKMNSKHLLAIYILLLEIAWTFANIEMSSTMKQVTNTERVPYSITNKTTEIQNHTWYGTESPLEYESSSFICSSGYRKSKNLCLPICSQDCINGVCSEPETCTCNSGYALSEEDDYHCKPHCSVPCTNGKCSSPETCSCDPNYSLDLSNKYRCIPICSKTCTNGICTAPETCACYAGYVLNPSNLYEEDKYQCKPYCSQPCINGTCNSPDTCTCKKGYSLNLRNKFICDPVCKEPCVNSLCVLPNVCQCHDDYEKTIYKNVCQPFCKTGCVNGICVKRKICRCHEEYELYNQKGCQQKCVDQNVCECPEGYGLYNQTSCKPICNKECTNGYCYKPEVCKCKDGFHFDPELSLCLPPKFTWNVTRAWEPLVVYKTPVVIWIVIGVLSGLIVLLCIALIIARKIIQQWNEYSHNNLNVQYTRTPHHDENESLDNMFLNYHL